eukprot:TRINITY_DN5603_c0_g1_i1.p1 TRINITY_DN5603_c0_g1~~TRINITY_DN5603_c0_g1_i1.p1  ORF type:complete len:178 (+),score=19.28 TRINITY_DN5603_c0_g1_i1:59-535(+)
MDEPQVSVALSRSPLPNYLTEMFFRFNMSGIFLSEFVDFFCHLVSSTSPSTFSLLSNFLVQNSFLEKLIQTFNDHFKRPIPRRVGNFGHMTKIANKIREFETKNKKLEKFLEGVPKWGAFVEILKTVNEQNTIPPDLRPTPEQRSAKKPAGEFDDSLM